MPPVENAKKTLWPWAFLALGLLLAGLSASGILAGYAPGFLESRPLFLGLCALALLPGLAYAWILSRGKSAPLLRLPYSPFILLACVHLSVQLSGGLKSPLLGAYVLLLLEAAPFVPLLLGLALAALATALELPAFMRGLATGMYLAPMALPWLGLAIGRMLSQEAPAVPASTALRAQAPRPDAAPAPELPMQDLPEIDPAAMLEENRERHIELAFHAHPAWNTVLVLWKEGAVLRPKAGRMRSGQLKMDFEVQPGEGVFGLTLREEKRLNIPELAPGNAASLPYYEGPVPAAALLALPFANEGVFQGLLVVDRLEKGEWSGDEMEALHVLGQQVVQQAQQAAFFAKVQAKGKHLSALYHVSKQLSMDLDAELLLKRVPELLQGLLPFDSYYLAMRERQRLRPGGPERLPGRLCRFLSAGRRDRPRGLGPDFG